MKRSSLPLLLALRYLFSAKRHNAVNLIAGVAVGGVALATAAMVVTLSVFNGFRDLVADLFTAFDPQLKIVATRGKVFDPGSDTLLQVQRLPEVAVWSQTLEEGAMVRYKDRQAMVIVKGVDEGFRHLAAIDSILLGEGEYLLRDSVADYGIMGVELVSELGTGIQPMTPLRVYAPRRGMRINVANPAASFNVGSLHSPGVVFIVNQSKYDAHYILAPLPFARRLFGYDHEVSAIELRLRAGANERRVRQTIAQLLGPGYRVLDRYEQQADVFRIVEAEKLVSYAFLTFIIVIACFNTIGSLSMLILNKRDDAYTLHCLGADRRLVERIFLLEGRLITVLGAAIGLALGVALCLLQARYGLVSLGGGHGQFLVNAYPVSLKAADVALVAATVVVVGFASVWWPVRYFFRNQRARQAENRPS